MAAAFGFLKAVVPFRNVYNSRQILDFCVKASYLGSIGYKTPVAQCAGVISRHPLGWPINRSDTLNYADHPDRSNIAVSQVQRHTLRRINAKTTARTRAHIPRRRMRTTLNRTKTYHRIFSGLVALVFLGAAFLAPALVHGDVYRWKDAEGHWHFTDSPPSNTDIERIRETNPETPPPGPATAAPSAETAGGKRRPFLVHSKTRHAPQLSAGNHPQHRSEDNPVAAFGCKGVGQRGPLRYGDVDGHRHHDAVRRRAHVDRR